MGKYGAGDHKWFQDAINTHGSGVWKGILKGWSSFVKNISFEIGDGSTIRFWKDRWCGDLELRRLFPCMYRLAVEKDCCINTVALVNDGRVGWSPRFRRNLQD